MWQRSCLWICLVLLTVGSGHRNVLCIASTMCVHLLRLLPSHGLRVAAATMRVHLLRLLPRHGLREAAVVNYDSGLFHWALSVALL